MVVATFNEKPFKNPAIPANKLPDPIYSRGYYSFYPTETWTPNVNLYETDTIYVVCVDLAGVEKQKIDLEVNDGHLVLRGKRSVPIPTDPAAPSDASQPRVRVHLMEIDHGAFARDVDLPKDVIQDKITARHENGLLWIELPKK
jgi:HSP20 family protein